MTTLHFIVYLVEAGMLAALFTATFVALIVIDRRRVCGLCPGDRIELLPWWRVGRTVGISKAAWEMMRKCGRMVVIAVDGEAFCAIYEPNPGSESVHDDCMDLAYHLDIGAVKKVYEE